MAKIVCAFGMSLAILAGCSDHEPRAFEPYQTIEFVPVDADRRAIPENVHSFSGFGLVLGSIQTSGTLFNPLLVDVKTNRFPPDDNSCANYLMNADAKQGNTAINLYNDPKMDSRVPRVAGFSARCVRVTYLGKDCEAAIDAKVSHATDRLTGEERQLARQDARLEFVNRYLRKLHECYPHVATSTSAQ